MISLAAQSSTSLSKKAPSRRYNESDKAAGGDRLANREKKLPTSEMTAPGEKEKWDLRRRDAPPQ